MRGQTNFTVLRYGSWGPQLKLVNKFGNLNSIEVPVIERDLRDVTYVIFLYYMA